MKIMIGMKAYRSGAILKRTEISLSKKDFEEFKKEDLTYKDYEDRYFDGETIHGYPVYEIVEIDQVNTGEKIEVGSRVFVKKYKDIVEEAVVTHIENYKTVYLCLASDFTEWGLFDVEEIVLIKGE